MKSFSLAKLTELSSLKYDTTDDIIIIQIIHFMSAGIFVKSIMYSSRSTYRSGIYISPCRSAADVHMVRLTPRLQGGRNAPPPPTPETSRPLQ